MKTQGTGWAAEVAQRLIGRDGFAITIQNGLGNFEALRASIGERRAAVGVIYVGARLDDGGELHATGAGRAELGYPVGAPSRPKLEALGRDVARVLVLVVSDVRVMGVRMRVGSARRGR